MNKQHGLEQMPAEAIFDLMIDDLYGGYPEAVVTQVSELLSRGIEPQEVLTRGLVADMDVVGVDFRMGYWQLVSRCCEERNDRN